MNARPIPIEAIYERDIDLLLLEELSVSTDFAVWFVRNTHPDAILFGSLESVSHSVIDQRRESDLVMIFLDSDGVRRAVLIENKIDAIAQPDQSGGYQMRAVSGVEQGRWASARTCIVAPEVYLAKNAEAKRYDVSVSYETIAEWFRQHSPFELRHHYRAKVLTSAIDQSRRSRAAIEDPKITAFWHAYWADISNLYPELEMPEPGIKSAGSTWILFRPTSLRKTRTIDHKLELGVVDLSMPSIPVARRDELEQRFLQIIGPHGMSLAVTGKSLAVRAKVPAMNPREEYSQQRANALAGMKAAYRAWVLAGILDPPAV
jgi:hypothetical protein